MERREALRIALTLAAGAAGGLAFALAHLPAPWLSGAMIGIALAQGLGLRPAMPDALRDTGMLFAGVVMGSAITPEMLEALGRYPASLALLAATTAAITLTGRASLTRLFGWERDTALFASLPGAMSAVLATAAAANVDLMRVATVQAFRMFVLVALLPSVVVMSVQQAPLRPSSELSIAGFAIVMLAGLAVALLFDRWRILAPFLLGGMLVAGVLHATALVPGAPPDLVVNLSMFLIGVFAGSRLGALNWATLRALLLPAIVLFFVTTIVAAIGAVLVWQIAGTPLPEALVAFAPGGLEAMVVLGMVLGLDPLYVSSHHIARFVMIAFGLPLIARLVLRQQNRDTERG